MGERRKQAAWSWLDKLKRKKIFMTLNLVLDYVISPEEKPGVKHTRELSINMILNAIAAKYPQGVKERPTQRTMKKVQDTLVRAKLGAQDSVEFNDEQAKFILDALKEWSVPTSANSWFVDLYEAMEKLVEDLAKPAPTEQARPKLLDKQS